MTAKEYCMVHEPIAQFNIFIDEVVYIYGIEYGSDNYVYLSDNWGSTKKYHKLRITYRNGQPYVTLHNVRIYLDQCIKLSEDFVIMNK